MRQIACRNASAVVSADAAQVDRIPGHRPGVVVLDDGQPRPARLARRRDHPQVQLGVVGLPDRIGPLGLAPVHQVEQRPVMDSRVVGAAFGGMLLMPVRAKG